jgi:hypothetical protein
MKEHAAMGNTKLQPNVVTYNICMSAWARQARYDAQAPERVEALFRQLCADHVASSHAHRLKPDPASYMARINAWERCRSVHSRVAAVRAAAVLDEMMAAAPDTNVVPTTLHFNRVMAAWSQCGDAVAAMALLERMLSDYLIRGNQAPCPNLSSFHFVMAAWSGQSCIEAAKRTESLLDRMQDLSQCHSGLEHLQPNAVSYNTCLSAWARSRDDRALAKAQALCRRMDEAGMARDSYSYGALLQIVASSTNNTATIAGPPRAELAQALVEEMRQSGLQPNDFVLRLVERCGK